MRAIKKEDLENINYYQVPKWLMDLFIDKKISQGAFKTYVMMYDRVRLSSKNNWIDKNGEVYIKYSYSEMAEELKCSRQSISNNLKDLEKLKLIDKKRQYSQSSVFYLNIYSDSSLENLTSKESLTDSSLENLDSSKNNFSNISIYLSKVAEITGVPLNRVEQKCNPVDIKIYNLETAMQEIEQSQFLQGKVPSSRGAYVSVDHFIKPEGLDRILSRQYRDKPKVTEFKPIQPRKSFNPDAGIIQPGEIEAKGMTEAEKLALDLGIIDKLGNVIG